MVVHGAFAELKAKLDATLFALADPNRRAVIDLLKTRPRRAGEIAAAVSLSPPALSRHLRVLRRTGLIDIDQNEADEDARIRIYRLRKEPFDQLRGWLGEVETFWVSELAAFRDHVEQSKARRGGATKRSPKQ
jgi:DNA-binding transcriptional ArsR family regulator